jgi:PadR family transcriptional regulator PadR
LDCPAIPIKLSRTHIDPKHSKWGPRKFYAATGRGSAAPVVASDVLLNVKRYICRIRHMLARSLSYAATAVLEAVAQGHQYGFDVIAVTGLASGTVYPALRRLEDAGYVESRWEDHRVAQREVRPVRKYYEVTESGQTALAAALLRYRALGRRRRASARVLRPSRT